MQHFHSIIFQDLGRNGRGPHLEGRQAPQASSAFRTPTAGSLQSCAFELWCWRRLWRVPWTARRSNQSILKEISPGICLEGMMLKLKLQYFGHLMQRVDSLEKTLMLGGIGDRRRKGRTNSRSSLKLTSIESVMPSSPAQRFS